jgi:hypothetical protein
MLNYLNKFNSSLYKILSNHNRVKELTAIQPHPNLVAKVLYNNLPFTILANQAMVFTLRMTIETIKNNSVYVLLPIKTSEHQECNIGSRIAGSNRNVGYVES